jgi:hypothetical protein
VNSAVYTAIGTGTVAPTTPAAVRTNLGLTATSGASLLGFIAADTGATARTVQDKLRDMHHIKDFGAVGDGTTNDTTAFTNAAATGRIVELTAGATYLISSGIAMTNGSGFICLEGYATLKAKTGTGGFNIKNTGGTRTDLDRCMISCVLVDNVTLDNINFQPDGNTEVVIYPVRTSGGGATKGFHFSNLEFKNFAASIIISLNSVGVGGYVLRNITSRNCTTAQGNAYWTGPVQITTVELDNDLVAGTPSVPGFMENIRCYDQLLTGQALTDFGQQTDCINVAGISGTDRKGPTIIGVYADGVGEVLDFYCSYAVVKGVRAKNVHYDVVKLIHGAQYNSIELDIVESCGRSAVMLSGSDQTAVHTQYNTVKVGTVTGVGTVGPLTGSACAAVTFLDGGGTGKPKNNVVNLGCIIGNGTDMDYVVSDGGSSNINNNIITVDKASGWAVSFCIAPQSNVRILAKNNTQTILRLTSDQTITTATPTLVTFNQVAVDINSEAVTASSKVRCQYPGWKSVFAQIRCTGLNALDPVVLELQKNGVTVKESMQQQVNGAANSTFSVSGRVYIGENEVNAAGADLSVQATITSAGTIKVTANEVISYFEVVDNL